MKYSNTALKELTKRYKNILIKCAMINAIALMVSIPAMADINVTEFTNAYKNHNLTFTYVGDEDDKSLYTHVGISTAPMYKGQKRPSDMEVPVGQNSAGGSYTGYQWVSKELAEDWDPIIAMDGGGCSIDPTKRIEAPEKFAADLYINNQKVAEMELILQKGDAE